jgi:hypothetical protein
MPVAEPFLHDLIDTFFGDEDLRKLCFELGGVYDYENLPGRTKHDKARELVAKAIRRKNYLSFWPSLIKNAPSFHGIWRKSPLCLFTSGLKGESRSSLSCWQYFWR